MHTYLSCSDYYFIRWCAVVRFGHAQLTKYFPAQRRHTLAPMDHGGKHSTEKLNEIPTCNNFIAPKYGHPRVHLRISSYDRSF